MMPDFHYLVEELYKDLYIECKNEDYFTEELLRSKINASVREVYNKRHYPSHYSTDKIYDDMENHYSIIREVSLVDFNRVGGEGESAHNENGTSRTFVDRKKLLSEVYRIAR